MDADGKDATEVAGVPAAEGEQTLVLNPAWEARGETVAFAVVRTTAGAWRQELWTLSMPQAVDGSAGRGPTPPQPTRIYAEEVATEYALSPARWDGSPMWAADGRLLFASDRGGPPQVWSLRPDGSDLHAITPPQAVWPALASDGLYFVRAGSDTPLWKVAADGSQLVPLAGNN